MNDDSVDCVMEMTCRKFAKHFSGIASFSYRPYKDRIRMTLEGFLSPLFVIVYGGSFFSWDLKKDCVVCLQ